MITEQELKDNLKDVRKRIEGAVEKSGRKKEDVKLICVSKTNPVEAIEYALSAGEKVFGENYLEYEKFA